MHIVKGEVVKKILIAWVISPLFAGILAFSMMILIQVNKKKLLTLYL